ncbi:hypothetical protein [Actinoplanes sp. NPDC023714]|uniref:hypothetical protein n=1 Tax=Actinoplanes sp. NPDC023714 TaxID=3154322 RepID=UPI0033D6E3CB
MLLVGGLVGSALLLFGARVLVTGRAPALIGRSFRCDRDAGGYHFLFGAALVIFVVGARLPGEASGTITALLSIALVATAVVRFRPRARRTSDD